MDIGPPVSPTTTNLTASAGNVRSLNELLVYNMDSLTDAIARIEAKTFINFQALQE